MKTRERILSTAIQLFNQSGTGAISTNHIADALGISPGNLYYHFRNKEAIIQAIFERLFDRWDVVFQLADDRAPTLSDLYGLVQANFRTMWEYRFIYRELLPLLRHDPQLSERYQSVRQRGFADFQLLVQVFASAGILAPPDDPQEILRLAELCWLISEFWLPTVELQGQELDQQHMQHGIELISQVLQPYIILTDKIPAPGDEHA